MRRAGRASNQCCAADLTLMQHVAESVRRLELSCPTLSVKSLITIRESIGKRFRMQQSLVEKKRPNWVAFKEAREGGKSGKAMQDGVSLGETTRDKSRMKEEG